MTDFDKGTVFKTLDAVDFALTAMPEDIVDADGSFQYAHGVVDGMRLAVRSQTHIDLSPAEVVRTLGDDVSEVLRDRNAVLGMLAGALTISKLFGTEQAIQGGPAA